MIKKLLVVTFIFSLIVTQSNYAVQPLEPQYILNLVLGYKRSIVLETLFVMEKQINNDKLLPNASSGENIEQQRTILYDWIKKHIKAYYPLTSNFDDSFIDFLTTTTIEHYTNMLNTPDTITFDKFNFSGMCYYEEGLLPAPLNGQVIRYTQKLLINEKVLSDEMVKALANG